MKFKKTCLICSKEFSVFRCQEKTAKYCSVPCKNRSVVKTVCVNGHDLSKTRVKTPRGSQYCRDCAAKHRAERNPYRRKTIHRNYMRKRLYGLTEEEFNALLIKQNFRCAICGQDEINEKDDTLKVDHDHATGRVRGLLCDRCNHGLGNFKDNKKRLYKAIVYLEVNSDFSLHSKSN